MTGSNGHVEPIAGAQQPARQPLQSDSSTPSVASAGWRPGLPPDDAGPARRRTDAPGLVVAAAVLAIVLGTILLVAATSGFGTTSTWMALLRLLSPAVLVLGGVQALRGRRGALTTGAVFLLLPGSVLIIQVLGSDLDDPRAATIEAAVRIISGVLLLVFSRVSASGVFFDTAAEYRYGRKEADFFR